MSDDLTRVIAEALECRYSATADRCLAHGVRWPCGEADRIAAELAPLIEARILEALTAQRARIQAAHDAAKEGELRWAGR